MAARVVINKRAIKELALSNDMVAAIRDHVEKVRGKAQAGAPVSKSGSHGRRAGYMRSRITTKYAKDSESVYGDVTTAARTPKGFPYGKMQETQQPYLKPAIE